MALNVHKRKRSAQSVEIPSKRRKSYREHPTLRSRAVQRNAMRCRRKFLGYYPKGFVDPDYLDLERGYKWQAHERWIGALDENEFNRLLQIGEFRTIANRAVAIESRTNLLFSFEKMALRDAVKPATGARRFAESLFEFLYGAGPLSGRFKAWCEA